MATPAPVVSLTERRGVVRRLPRADVDALLTRFRHVVELVPTLERGRYKLTARGYVGVFRTPNRVWHVRPKLGWGGLRFLLDGTPPAAEPQDNGYPEHWPAAVLSLLASGLAALLRVRAEAGLLRGYVEREDESATVRGRIDLPRQLRDASRPGNRFHLIADEFTTDIDWNRLPATTVRRLLDTAGLDPAARGELAHALTPFAGVGDLPDPPAAFGRLHFDARTEPYRELVACCRTVLAALGGGEPGDGCYLLNLEHLFETHVATVLSSVSRHCRGWVVRSGRPFQLVDPLGCRDALTLVPDLTVFDPAGRPRAVWDVKWKVPGPAGPDPADVHQALGYAAALGVPVAGLIYPGRRSAARAYHPPGGAVRLLVVTHRVVGDRAALIRAADRLVRRVCRPDR